MDAKTSLVMCNVAGLLPGDKVLDPFAGSGGLLLAAAELGAGALMDSSSRNVYILSSLRKGSSM